MRWLQTEYLLKGLFLGLILYAALRLSTAEGDWPTVAYVNLTILGGFLVALLIAGTLQLRQGFRIRGRLLVFVLFLLLESPHLIYLGILGGAGVGILGFTSMPSQGPGAGSESTNMLLMYTLVGGGVGGLVFGMLRQVRQRLPRALLILALAAGLMFAGLCWFGLIDVEDLLPDVPAGSPPENPIIFSVQLLLGIPFFYILTFAGVEEESEVEIGAMCATLGLGLAILLNALDLKRMGVLAVILPLLIYFMYTTRVLPGLRLLKHAFRGLSYSRAGQHRKALLAFRRALQLDPNHKLARSGFWETHLALDYDQLSKDPETLALVDLELCMNRAGSLLIAGKPTPDQMDEARRLLHLVLQIQPDLRPINDYWEAVASTHEQRYEDAAFALERVVDPATYGLHDPHRRAVLLPAWQLALNLHPELRKRVGDPQLAIPGRRMEAIAAVERHLGETPEDPSILPLKRSLYQDLTEADYDALAGEGLAAKEFDHQYAQQLGLSLIHDSEHWERGGEYLRLAARGLPTQGPSLFVQIAQAHQRAGNEEGARHNYELAKRTGRSVGPGNLDEEEKQVYFSTVKLLAEDALAREDLPTAIENYQFYTESEHSGLATLRILADLHERRGDALAALRVTDQALCYDSKDADLLERKDRYYYSVMPEQLRDASDNIRKGFDLDYCIRKTRSILEGRYTDAEWLDVAHHLIQLAHVIDPERFMIRVMLARVLLRMGERDQAVTLLEGVREARPESFGSGEEEEAWYLSCQLLGDLYLELGRADEAVASLQDFRKSPKSGARTYFKLGQAFEALGDSKKAVSCYQQVTAYDGNPLAPEAEDALARLESGE